MSPFGYSRPVSPLDVRSWRNKCYCLFEGDAEAVKDANVRAGLPLDRIVEAKLLASEDLP